MKTTLVLVLLTLFGALPVYRRVARESPQGEGSIAMLEHLLSWWKGKLFVLTLLGFAATDFIITITLSAADATAHLIENPYTHRFLDGHAVGATLVLIALLGGVFLKGFKEAIGIAVALVGIYLVLNTVVIGVGLMHLAAAAGTPTLGLFGPTPASEYAPSGRRAAAVLAPGPPGTTPIADLPLQAAIAAALALLDQARPPLLDQARP